MNKEKVLAAAGSLTFHALCVAGLVFWNTDLSSESAPLGVTETQQVASLPTDTMHTPGVGPAVAALDSTAIVLGKPVDASEVSLKSTKVADPKKVQTKLDLTHGTKSTPVVEGSYSWPEGEKRKKVSGPLPRPINIGKLPERVSIDLTVSPNGTVHAIKVNDPSGSGFEREAVRVLRRWRFEVLPRSKPQREYRCNVTLRVKI